MRRLQRRKTKGRRSNAISSSAYIYVECVRAKSRKKQFVVTMLWHTLSSKGTQY